MPRAPVAGNEPSRPALRSIRAALLDHYDAHARDLPWRRTRDPYAIWVSEIMLQQTRVDTVLRYYEPFLARFPNAQTLAAAEEDAVLAAWSGLGYYRRARLLHAGVREVVAQYAGYVPKDSTLRRSLPGIGRYTAGAIGSIAFDLPEPLVDGNVARVFARLFAIDTPLGRADTQTRLWALAEALVPGPRPGALNQALMEIGATLCTKAAPSCTRCPVATHCEARAQERVRALPVVTKKRPPKPVALVGVVVSNARRELLLVRGAEQLFGGLWNLPMAEGSDHEAAAALLKTLGVHARLHTQTRGEFEHVLTHRRLSVQMFVADLVEFAASSELKLHDRAQLSQLGVSRLTSKALAAVLASDAS
jgi:A/G-specific adenine glycosylase